MQLVHEFTVPVPIDRAWDVLLDVERVGQCMPGAVIESVDGDSFTGKVKVKVGPITAAYAGSASFLEKDAEARRVVMEARGREVRGSGTAGATITAEMFDAGESTNVRMVTDLAITGRPAQFGRGVMNEVGNRLLAQFATSLAAMLAQPDGTVGDVSEARLDAGSEVWPDHIDASSAQVTDSGPKAGSSPAEEPIDLLDVARSVVARRPLALAGAVAGLLAVLGIAWAVRRKLAG